MSPARGGKHYKCPTCQKVVVRTLLYGAAQLCPVDQTPMVRHHPKPKGESKLSAGVCDEQPSRIEMALRRWTSERGIVDMVTEFRFYPPRRWRFDFAWPTARVALEVNGGAWSGGRHTRGAGYISDMHKLNRAQLEGYVVLQCTPQAVTSGEILPFLMEALVG